MRAFVERLYTCCLGRAADEDGLENWANALANGATGSEVAAGFVFSQEYKNKNATNSQYIDMLYQTMLGREADESGRSIWHGYLLMGYSREYVYNGFVGSTEFANLCENAGIAVGGAIADNGTTGPLDDGTHIDPDSGMSVPDDFEELDPSLGDNTGTGGNGGGNSTSTPDSNF